MSPKCLFSCVFAVVFRARPVAALAVALVLSACTNADWVAALGAQVRASWYPAEVEVRQGQQAVVELGVEWSNGRNWKATATFAAPPGVRVSAPDALICTRVAENCSTRLKVTLDVDAVAVVGDVFVIATADYEDDLGRAASTASLRVRLTAAASTELAVEVEGSGRVTSNPAGLDCSAAVQPCVRSFDSASAATLLATPEPGWRVELADGDCQVVGGVGAQTLSVMLNPNGTSRCRVRFTANRRVEITVLGAGSVQLGSIVCPPTCAVDLGSAAGTTLAAMPASGSHLVAWSGDCNGTNLEQIIQFASLGRALAQCTASFASDTSTSTGNLVLNPGFDQIVAAGDLPSLAGVWQGDATNTVPAEGGITPHGGASMLKFIATGPQATANLVSSQMWQIVDLQTWATAIDAGGVRVDASAWFNRVTGGPNTDRRFDLRVLAFDTTDAGVPQRYQANGALAVQAASVNTAGAAWQQASLQLVLPPQTRVVLVEIYAYEDVLNDAVAPEFDGHYADDVVLTLTVP